MDICGTKSSPSDLGGASCLPSVTSPRVKEKQRAQTRGKLKRLRGHRGSMANRENTQGEPDERKCSDWKDESGIETEKGMWENVMFGEKQRIVYEEENLDS